MSVYKPKGARKATAKTPYYHYDFQLDGRRFHGSTGRTTLGEARAVEAARRREAARLVADGSIAAAFGRFWTEKGSRDRDAATTFERLERLQDGLAAILAELGRPETLPAIDDDVLAHYVARRQVAKGRHGRPLSPATVNRELQCLRRVMRRAQRVWKQPLALPDWGALLLAEPEPRIRVLPHDLEARIAARLRPDFRPVLHFLAMTGLRIGSVLAGGPEGHGPLAPADVDFDAGVLTARTKSSLPGGRLIRLPITRAMTLLLANELAHRHPDAVFTYEAQAARGGRRRGRRYPLTYTAFYSAFKQAARDEGFPELRPHDLRHTAAHRTLAATGNLRLAQTQLGHTRVTTTQRYTHPDLEDLRAAMERVHAPPEPAPAAGAAPSRPMPAGRKRRRSRAG